MSGRSNPPSPTLNTGAGAEAAGPFCTGLWWDLTRNPPVLGRHSTTGPLNSWKKNKENNNKTFISNWSSRRWKVWVGGWGRWRFHWTGRGPFSGSRPLVLPSTCGPQHLPHLHLPQDWGTRADTDLWAHAIQLQRGALEPFHTSVKRYEGSAEPHTCQIILSVKVVSVKCAAAW